MRPGGASGSRATSDRKPCGHRVARRGLRDCREPSWRPGSGRASHVRSLGAGVPADLDPSAGRLSSPIIVATRAPPDRRRLPGARVEPVLSAVAKCWVVGVLGVRVARHHLAVALLRPGDQDRSDPTDSDWPVTARIGSPRRLIVHRLQPVLRALVPVDPGKHVWGAGEPAIVRQVVGKIGKLD